MKKQQYDEVISDFEWLRYKESFNQGERATLTNMYKKHLGKSICAGCGGLWEIKFELLDFFCQIKSSYEAGLLKLEDEPSVVQVAITNVKNFSTATEKLKEKKENKKK